MVHEHVDVQQVQFDVPGVTQTDPDGATSHENRVYHKLRTAETDKHWHSA